MAASPTEIHFAKVHVTWEKFHMIESTADSTSPYLCVSTEFRQQLDQRMIGEISGHYVLPILKSDVGHSPLQQLR